MISSIADIFLKLYDKIKSYLRTAQASKHAILSRKSKVLSDGRIINLYGDKSRIKIGINGRIRGEILCFAHEGCITIGDWFYVGPNSLIWSADKKGITIGDRVLISSDVTIFDNNGHPLDKDERYKQTIEIFERGHPKNIKTINSAPVFIDDDVWICKGATIMKGVRIGEGAIIGSNATILADVKKGSLVQPGAIHTKNEIIY